LPTTPPSWPRCAQPVCPSWARPTWTSSRWAPRPRAVPSGPPAIPGTVSASRAARAAAARPPWPPTRRRWRAAALPAARSGGPAAGSAAATPPAVAPSAAPLAIASDTGGSIRQPGAVTGTVGVKPTYGSVSRYGLIALASSLDQAGPVARTVEDAALLHELIA